MTTPKFFFNLFLFLVALVISGFVLMQGIYWGNELLNTASDLNNELGVLVYIATILLVIGVDLCLSFWFGKIVHKKFYPKLTNNSNDKNF